MNWLAEEVTLSLDAGNDGGFWLASQWCIDRMIWLGPLYLNSNGEIDREVSLRFELLAVESRFGCKVVTLVGGTLWMLVQHERQMILPTRKPGILYIDAGESSVAHFLKTVLVPVGLVLKRYRRV